MCWKNSNTYCFEYLYKYFIRSRLNMTEIYLQNRTTFEQNTKQIGHYFNVN